MNSPHLDKQRALGTMTATKTNISARLVQDQGTRIRVGDAYSPVSPGDLTPTGGIYRAGQYSPHVDDLAVSTFSAAKNAGILPSGLPIFDENGDVDVDKLDAWKPSQANLPVSFAEDLPVYSSAVIVSAFKHVDSSLLENLNVGVMQAPRTIGDFGNYIVGARTNGENRQFSSQMFVYPDFYKFIDKPIVPKTPKRESGLSVSSFMVFHALGHILISKLSFDGKIKEIADFMDSSGWTKVPNSTHEKAWFMGRKSTSAWYRDTSHRFLSELSRYSPMDDFAQAFAFYHTSNDYFNMVDPKKYAIMHKVISEQL
jgi:hypothetical protein